MTDSLYARAKSIFLEALEQEASAREGFIERACQGEADLRREVEALLDHHDPKSIVGEWAEVAQEHPAKGRVLQPRPGASSSAGTRPFYARARPWALLAFALLLGLGLWSRQRAEHGQLNSRARELQVILDAQLLHHIVNTDPKPLSEVAAQSLPPGLVSLVTSCLAKDPAARPQSARELGERLSSLSGVPLWTQQDAARWWQANPGPA